MTGRSRILDRIDAGRAAAAAGRIPGVRERRKILRRMLVLLVSHREAAYSVLADDLGRSRQSAIVSEIIPLISTIKYLIRKLPSLTAESRSRVAFINFPGRGYQVPEPFGHVLIYGSWNYPLLSALEPVAGAYAAGNHVVLKLSGRAPKSAQFVRWLIEETFVGDEVVTVDREAGFTELLEYGFDKVFCTGDREEAVKIKRSCAESLTPSICVAGGKSPAIVNEDAVLSVAANRIVQSKFFNAGQSRTAPDLLLVHERVYDRFQSCLRSVVRETFGPEPLENPDYARIIDSAAYERLSKLAKHGRLVCGGEKDPEKFKIAPTVIDMLSEDDELFREEVFGPLLPVMLFSSEEDLVCKLKKFSRPPAVYCFSTDSSLIRRLIRDVPSGMLGINDAAMQFFDQRMPGKEAFSNFIRYKSVVKQFAFLDLPWRSLPLKGIYNLILEYWVKWSI